METGKQQKYLVPAGTVIITGPQGCGNSRNAQILASHYGKRRVIDNWTIGTPVPSDAIALTTETRLINAISFKNALRAAGLGAARGFA
ncbi:hypothetical protein [Herbaspirillum sp. ST 5-3]|uniref:hypothetical protein n=1 Tax=Oxalobacteraceae TaxID=75682 RepID=UPI0010A3E65F|nr:hypothetical protein [Herbaspirillum sp. ST 5-3]